MKKLFVVMVFLTLWGKGAFGDTGKQEEVGFLLFLPNSSDQFADVDQAMARLDTAARYLKSRNILPGQIYVYGYAANVANDIEPNRLSLDRALFVIQELQKRGIASGLFADPVGYGHVDLWGGNIDEADRSPNRRVRILLENIPPTPAATASESAAAIPEEKPAATTPAAEPAAVTPKEKPSEKPRSSFPWLLLLLALLVIAAIIFFASRRKKNASAEPMPVSARKAEPPVEPIPVAAQKAEPPVEPMPVSVRKAEPPVEPIPVSVRKAEPPVEPIPVSTRKTEPAVEPIPVSVRKAEPPVEPIPVSVRKAEPPVEPIPVAAQKAEPPKEKIVILEEEEIRRHAYGLYERRYGQNGDAVGDWHQSICELTAHYEGLGYRVILYWEQR
ncbi:MAG: hypothetical protein LBU85_01815 [Treponema sp.]|jgi:hypothetical protein|nr:hypothetical protein [Treponema sp.]